MPLKTIVCPIQAPTKFSQDVEDAMQKIQEQFLAFNQKHMGKPAEVAKTVAFHATETYLVCIIYYSWNLVDQATLLLPTPGPSGPRRIQ